MADARQQIAGNIPVAPRLGQRVRPGPLRVQRHPKAVVLTLQRMHLHLPVRARWGRRRDAASGEIGADRDSGGQPFRIGEDQVPGQVPSRRPPVRKNCSSAL